ncbi:MULTISPECIES: dimethylsulfonioproprionate lyase family protein [unclassified Mesorhizobium]|uniref:dimethylsulfonioproprionate lyase family protein n=1 Tax=unclassified Mesorhizobium TaxID=325217 RepID=UPI001091F4BD|nr:MULTISPECIES: dimethylsulfonioproprionate lyase family protein [unclassified Mesorhizobium]TGQ40547.1 transcriptional regulator [Mesorhizobium sp. M4B.F.Ca.ET.214.01.1.1]TGQ60604.1 transcriptional regulator [Mesorhizobium sp. M4B.F.Ca.ET.211.01.1.1]TGU36472.1 transcriptional regulator [Mesorhizobium sp. M4B.F.Ca.ET.150.01.1.1]TIX17026.1 MAG: transcriptional regulator [Mesorhizobium sp.]
MQKRRSDSLQELINAARAAFEIHATDRSSRQAISCVFSALENPRPERVEFGLSLPACQYLNEVRLAEDDDPSLLRLLTAFNAIESRIRWRRDPPQEFASANFIDGHANAMIIGPNGIEDRHDVWLGASILGPHVCYPVHQHSPEEVYLALSEGEFWHGSGEWFAPGIGGSFYNPPSIQHAMRSGPLPLLAFWVLRSQKGSTPSSLYMPHA